MIVELNSSHLGTYRVIESFGTLLFEGTLDECLEYMRTFAIAHKHRRNRLTRKRKKARA